MFGVYIRAAITIGIAVVSALILQFIVPFLLPYQGPEDGLMYQSFDTLADNALFIMLLAVAAAVMAGAIRQSGRGVR